MFPYATPAIIKSAVAILKPQDVFATSLYAGNGSTQTITNGLNLLAKGGMVWSKSRNNAGNHFLFDTVRGAGNSLGSNLTDAEAVGVGGVTSFNADGFSLNQQNSNSSFTNYAAQSFAFAPKFCVAVTWTGDGTSNRLIPHGLGVVPGMFVAKRRDVGGSSWPVYHRSLSTPASDFLLLNTTGATASASSLFGAVAGSAAITVGPDMNVSGATYVAYLFAHDPSADGIVQCGSFTTDSNGGASIVLPWQPQYVMFKATNTADGWYIFDAARGFGTQSKYLFANSSGTEITGSGTAFVNVSSTGFQIANGQLYGPGVANIYLVIRAPY